MRQFALSTRLSDNNITWMLKLELCHIFFLESDSLEGQQLKSSCYKVGRWLSAKSSQLDFGFFMAKLSNWNSSFSLLPRKHESLIWSQQELWDLLFVMACRVIDIVLCYISFLLLVFAFSSYFHQRAKNNELSEDSELGGRELGGFTIRLILVVFLLIYTQKSYI